MEIQVNSENQINEHVIATMQPLTNECSGCGKLSVTYCIKINLEDEDS